MDRTEPTVLAIVGSPRHGGNTERLVEEILRGARDAGATTYTMPLADLDIRPCIACEQCLRMGRCAQSDALNEVAEKMHSASVWVLGTPVYLFAPTALFKAFLERWIGIPEENFVGKKAILVVPLAAPSPDIAEPTLQILRRSLDFRSVEHLGSVVGPGLLDAGDVTARPELLQQAYDIGRRCVAKAAELPPFVE